MITKIYVYSIHDSLDNNFYSFIWDSVMESIPKSDRESAYFSVNDSVDFSMTTITTNVEFNLKNKLVK